MEVFIYIIAVVLVISLVWNLITNRRTQKLLKANISSNDRNISDQKYWELKSKNEFLIAAFSFIVAVISFLGYNTYEKANEKIYADNKQKTDSIFIALSNAQKKTDSLKKTIEVSKNNFESIKNRLDPLKSDFTELQKLINKLSNKNILKLNYYMINDLNFKKDFAELDTIYYKDLRTSNGDLLPEFDNPPIISASSNYYTVETYSVSKDYFVTTISMGYSLPGTKFEKSVIGLPYQLIIFEN